MWLVFIERSFQGLSVAIETVRIDEELMEIWPNEVCDNHSTRQILRRNCRGIRSTETWQTRWRRRDSKLGCLWGRITTGIQWQDERSRRRMVHRNIHTRKETYRRFPYWIHSFSKQSTNRRSACNIFAEKERKQGNYQSHNGISTNPNSQEPRTVEGSNHSSRTRIRVDQHPL